MTNEEAWRYYDIVDECINKISNAQSRVYDDTRTLEGKDRTSVYLYNISCELDTIKQYFASQIDEESL